MRTTGAPRVKATSSIFNTLPGISIMSISLDAHSESTEEVCNKPIFKMWKEQQSERLWSPDDETLWFYPDHTDTQLRAS